MIIYGDIFRLQLKRLQKENKEYQRLHKKENDIKELFFKLRELLSTLSDENAEREEVYQLYLKYERKYYKL